LSEKKKLNSETVKGKDFAGEDETLTHGSEKRECLIWEMTMSMSTCICNSRMVGSENGLLESCKTLRHVKQVLLISSTQRWITLTLCFSNSLLLSHRKRTTLKP